MSTHTHTHTNRVSEAYWVAHKRNTEEHLLGVSFRDNEHHINERLASSPCFCLSVCLTLFFTAPPTPPLPLPLCPPTTTPSLSLCFPFDVALSLQLSLELFCNFLPRCNSGTPSTPTLPNAIPLPFHSLKLCAFGQLIIFFPRTCFFYILSLKGAADIGYSCWVLPVPVGNDIFPFLPPAHNPHPPTTTALFVLLKYHKQMSPPPRLCPDSVLFTCCFFLYTTAAWPEMQFSSQRVGCKKQWQLLQNG